MWRIRRRQSRALSGAPRKTWWRWSLMEFNRATYCIRTGYAGYECVNCFGWDGLSARARPKRNAARRRALTAAAAACTAEGAASDTAATFSCSMSSTFSMMSSKFCFSHWSSATDSDNASVAEPDKARIFARLTRAIINKKLARSNGMSSSTDAATAKTRRTKISLARMFTARILSRRISAVKLSS
mmetsp:Transcript_6976/g.25433  ORF Transcript_6976/g.25433 Transcript_6976/m.25433 type:complete len:186 (-) Transcript_6976:922-1479(-)